MADNAKNTAKNTPATKAGSDSANKGTARTAISTMRRIAFSLTTVVPRVAGTWIVTVGGLLG